MTTGDGAGAAGRMIPVVATEHGHLDASAVRFTHDLFCAGFGLAAEPCRLQV